MKDKYFDPRPIKDSIPSERDTVSRKDTSLIKQDSLLLQKQTIGFGQAPLSIMSAQIKEETADSIIQQIKPKRIIKHNTTYHKYYESFLIIKKDSFMVLNNLINDTFSIHRTLSPIRLKPVEHKDIEKFVSKKTTKIQKDTCPINEIKKTILLSKTENIPFKTQNKTISYYHFPSPNPKKEKKELHNTTQIKKTIASSRQEHTKEQQSIASEPWLIILLLASISLSAITQYSFKNNLRKYYQAIFSYHFFNQIYENQNINKIRLSYLLNGLSTISISLIVYYSYLYIPNNSHFNHHFSSFLNIIAYYFLATVLYKISNLILGYVFNSSQLMTKINFNLSFFLIIIGIISSPFALSIPYLPDSLKAPSLVIIWFTIVLLSILRWIRALQISFKFYVPYLYWIIYLCTLEIVPVMFVLKWSF